jgi:hypothetical protein
VAEYKIRKYLEGTTTLSPQYEFGELRTRVQVFGGGYGNGKTAAAVVQKALLVARDYPGANILIARSTYPKLNDTIRKEFLKWCPPSWIKSFPRSKNSDNTCTLTNGSVINFRYIAQQGKGANDGEQTTSNLLSATYDLIIVDQMEDPEIVEKDFDDLLGRLRGNARYIGNDPTMPMTGPRWFVICVNPTRNWVYRRLIAPYLKYKKNGIIDPELLCVRYKRGHPKEDEPVLDEEGKPKLLISLVEGSTYTNSHNLGEDFIELLESAYRGQARDRFLYGEWAAYEGLVYPSFSELVHCIDPKTLFDYVQHIMNLGVVPTMLEAYDFGMSKPSCYLLAIKDRYKNILVLDGFYKPTNEMYITEQQETIMELRYKWGLLEDNYVHADPATSKRTIPVKDGPSKTVAKLFAEGKNPIRFRNADNSIAPGIIKMTQYLEPMPMHRHPITGELGSPHMYYNSDLTFIFSEMTSYYWKMDKDGSRTDEPIDKNDHAMDTNKYLLSKEPPLAQRIRVQPPKTFLTNWTEVETTDSGFDKGHRYGR